MSFGLRTTCILLLGSFGLVFAPFALAQDSPGVDEITPIGQVFPTCIGKIVREIDAKKIREVLRNVPELVRPVLDILDDPLVPDNIKQIIRHGLTGSFKHHYSPDRLEIVRVFQNLPRKTTKADLGHRPRIKAFEAPGIPRKAKYTPMPTELRTDFKLRLTGRVLLDRRMATGALIHELAHLRFISHFDWMLMKSLGRRDGDLLEPNAARRWANRFPDFFVRVEKDGTIAINSQFWQFLAERYAHEASLEYLRDAYSRGIIHQWPEETYPGLSPKDEPDPGRAKSRMLQMKFDKYELTDPRIIALTDRTNRSILLGNVQEAIEVDRVMKKIPILAKTTNLEQIRMLVKINRMIEEDGLKSESSKEVLKEITVTLETNKGALPKAQQALLELLYAYDQNAAMQARVLEFFDRPELRDFGFSFPRPRDRLYSPKFLLEHDTYFTGVKKLNLRKNDPQMNLIREILDEPLGGQATQDISQDPEKYALTFERARDANDAARAVAIEHQNQRVSPLDLRNADAEWIQSRQESHLVLMLADLHSLGRPAFQKLLDRLHISREFKIRYPTFDAFWSDPKPFVEIIHELKEQARYNRGGAHRVRSMRPPFDRF